MVRSLPAWSLAIVVAALSTGACTDAPSEEHAPADDDGGKADRADSPDNPLVPAGTNTKHPIILVHGFAASPQFNGFTEDVAWALCADGHSVFLPTLPAFASSDTRSRHLASVVDSILAGATDFCGRTPAEDQRPTKVNIIAHSMGGVDSRYLVQRGYADRVASVISISSPHRGSGMADLMLRVGAWKDRSLGSVGGTALMKLGEFIGHVLPSDPSGLGPDLEGAFRTMLTVQAFDLSVPAGVRAESWAGLSNIAGILNPQDAAACEHKMSTFSRWYKRHVMAIVLKPIAIVVAEELRAIPNDGLVQVERAKWGTFRGCIPADHADQVGAFGVLQFDHIRFVRNRAFELAAFGL